MLQNIRDNLTGPIVWFVVGLIVVPFAFWGIDSFFQGAGSDPVVVKVGSDEITQAEFRAGYERRYQQLQAMLGENFRADLFDQNRFRQSVLDDMVQESLMQQFSREAGYRAGDAALFDYLSNIPAFQENGKFSSETYKRLLASRGMNPQGFEAQLRDSLINDQLRAAVVDTAFVTPADLAQSQRLAGQERKLAYAEFSAAQYLDKIVVGDEQVRQRYESQQSRYMAPERIKLAYVELDLEKLPKAGNPGADTLKVLYDAEKDSRYSTPEERRASHILIAFGADKDEAKKKLEGLAEKAAAGGNFAELAKANSEDPGSKTEGGSLGWVRRGAMVQKFEEALFGLKQGEVSGPVETEFGWHLIKLDELKAASVRPFEDAAVQAELLEVWQNREVEKLYQEQSEKLELLAFENPASLEPVATALGLKVETTDWFTRAGGAGIAANDAVKQAAFSTEVLGDAENSKPLLLDTGRSVVVRKAEYEAPRQRELAEVSAEILAELKAEGAKAKAGEEARGVLAAVQGGQPLMAALAGKGGQIKFDGVLKRDNQEVDTAVVAAGFKLPRPVAGAAQFKQIDLANGDVAVLVLSEVKDPQALAANDPAAQRASGQQRDAVGGSEFNAYRKAIESEIKVKHVNPVASESAPAEVPES